MPPGWQNLPFQKLGTYGGFIIGSLQKGARIYKNAPGKELQAQLQEARRLLKENPHQDKYVKHIAGLEQQVNESRKQAITWKNGALTLRDGVFFGVAGNLLGWGVQKAVRPSVAEAVVNSSVTTASKKAEFVKKYRAMGTEAREAWKKENFVARTSPFDPRDYREMDANVRTAWEKAIGHKSIEALRNPSPELLAQVKLELVSEELLATLPKEQIAILANTKAAIIAGSGGKRYLYIGPKANGLSVPHEIYHEYQRQFSKKLVQSSPSDDNLMRDLRAMLKGNAMYSGKERLNWTSGDLEIEKRLGSVSVTPLQLAALKTKCINEIKAHRAGREFVGAQIGAQDLAVDLSSAAKYKRLVYLIGQEEQRRGLGAYRAGFNMRVPGGVASRLSSH